MKELPVCQFRGDEISPGHWKCSNHSCYAFISKRGVSPRTCLKCEEIGYADKTCDHIKVGHRPARNTEPPKPPEIGVKPGSLLKWMIWKSTGIIPAGDCSCNQRAAQMDAWGWVKTWWNRETVYEWLVEEAAKRGRQIDRAAFWPLLKAGFKEWRTKNSKQGRIEHA